MNNKETPSDAPDGCDCLRHTESSHGTDSSAVAEDQAVIKVGLTLAGLEYFVGGTRFTEAIIYQRRLWET